MPPGRTTFRPESQQPDKLSFKSKMLTFTHEKIKTYGLREIIQNFCSLIDAFYFDLGQTWSCKMCQDITLEFWFFLIWENY